VPLGDLRYPRTRCRRKRAVIADIDRLLAEIRAGVDTGLHLGAGHAKIPGLINCDLYNQEADMQLDAADLKPFADNSVDLIESHHMIEHLSFAEAENALEEWYRVLRPRGILVLTCPDITGVCLRWIKYSFAYPVYPRADKLDYTLKMMVGSQEHGGMFHKSAYDVRRMRRVLNSCGFNLEFSFSPYPKRPTPSLLTISRRKA